MNAEQDKVQWIYGQLCDEESRYLFENRRKYAESGEWKYIENIVRSIPQYADNVYYGGKEQELYRKLRAYGKKIILFGYGYRAKKLYRDLCAEHLEMAYIVDSDEKKQGAFAGKTPIVSLRYVVERENTDQCVFLITSSYHAEEIRVELSKCGCRYVEDANLYGKCFRQDQYFDRGGFLEFAEQEVFVDGGCFDLETTRILMERLEEEGKKCRSVYAFEPDRNNYLACKKKTAHGGWHNIRLVNAGLWHEPAALTWENAGTAGAHLAEAAGEGGGRCQVKAVSLDSVVEKREQVTFIKLDVEGAELEALQGAKRIITENRPKLAVCLYHKKEDYWRIPYYVKSLVPEYRLYIRHYSNYSAETVLYAV